MSGYLYQDITHTPLPKSVRISCIIYVGTRSIPLFREESVQEPSPSYTSCSTYVLFMFMITLGIGFRDLPVYLEGALKSITLFPPD
jgi:hypothetical protein